MATRPIARPAEATTSRAASRLTSPQRADAHPAALRRAGATALRAPRALLARQGRLQPLRRVFGSIGPTRRLQIPGFDKPHVTQPKPTVHTCPQKPAACLALSAASQVSRPAWCAEGRWQLAIYTLGQGLCCNNPGLVYPYLQPAGPSGAGVVPFPCPSVERAQPDFASGH